MSNQSDMQYCPECGIKSTAGARVLRGEKGMSAATQNEMERLRNERDLARRDYEVMNMFREAAEQDLEAALEREQTLAAYTQRLTSAIEACLAGDERAFVYTPDEINELEKALDLKFSTSLARRDLIKQAEALEGMADNYGESTENDLRNMADDLRQQAEAQDD